MPMFAVPYLNMKTVNALHKTIKVDKTCFHINLQVFNHITVNLYHKPLERGVQDKIDFCCNSCLVYPLSW